MNKKKYYTTLVVFSVLVATALFYLTVIRDLPIFTVDRNIGFNSNLNLNIIEAKIENSGDLDIIKISDDGKTPSFDVNFKTG